MKTSELIKKFSDEFGYVKDIEGLIEHLDENNIPLELKNEILTMVLKWNEAKNNELTQKLNRIQHQKQKIVQEEKESLIEVSVKVEYPNIPNVKFYLKQIRQCQDTDFITDILPSIYDTNYEEIIMTIIIELYNEIYLANQMLKSSENEDEKNYLQSEISRYTNIIGLVKEYNKNELEAQSDEIELPNGNNRCTLIYLEKPDGTPYIYDDIKDINENDYEFTSAIFSTLMLQKNFNEKRFHNLEDLKGISAIRKKDSRVIFARIDNNTIIILGAFTKRFQNPSTYRDFLRRRAQTFKVEKEELKERKEDSSFISHNEDVTSEITSILKNDQVKKLKKV